MSDEHDHHDHAHEPHVAAPEDAGSQALAEALRSSFAIVKFVMVVLVIIFFGSGFFQVGTQEKAIILRFGKPVGEGPQALLGPGLHWSFPYPIDEVVRIPITEIQKVTSTIGWYAVTPEQELTGNLPPAGPSLIPGVDGYVITADRNILHVRATLYYQVDNPVRYALEFASASDTVQNALDNALLYTASHFKVDDILYYNFAAFRDAVELRVSTLADQERLGITVKQCTVDKAPPRQLADVFAQVTEARQNQTRVLDDAHTWENGVTNNAGAQAAAIVSEAQSARNRYVQSLQADAKAFSALLPNYQINPNLFKQQKLVQVMGEALTNADFKAYLPTSANGEPLELRLMLNREPPGLKTGAAGQ
ncbi:MAG TPA: protease modulator HflK [Candidatus Limnocylindrales bacterium]|nr:protease modulator HflK [Candidatus Limnocylindrales bacterium]